MTNKETIDHQKLIAEFVTETVGGVVAGGAPRDWFLKKPAQDIDIFIKSEEHVVAMSLLKLGFSVRSLGNTYSGYEDNHIQAVYELTGFHDGPAVQVIVLDVDPEYYVNTKFCCNLSKAIFKFGQVYASQEFLTGIEKKQLVFTSDATKFYIDKITKRFPRSWTTNV